MNIKNVYILDDRAILYINGEDVKEFLQNLISNDINKVSETNTCFASLLSPQGKFLYEFIIIKHKSGYLIDCEKSQADGLYKQLSIYKLRSKVEILNLSNEFVVAAFSHEKFLTFDEAQDFSGFTLKYREDPIFLDPRNKQLGARLIINLEKLYLSLKKLDLHDADLNEYYSFSHEKFLTFDEAKDSPGFTLKYREDPIFLDPRNKQLGARLIINLEKLYLSLKKLDLHDANLDEYYSFSHKLGIVPKHLNKLQNKLFGIECNYEELNGIDFKKGC